MKGRTSGELFRCPVQHKEDKVQVLCLGFWSGLSFQQAVFPEPLVMQLGLAAAGHSHPLPPSLQCFTSLAAGNPARDQSPECARQKSALLCRFCTPGAL